MEDGFASGADHGAIGADWLLLKLLPSSFVIFGGWAVHMEILFPPIRTYAVRCCFCYLVSISAHMQSASPKYMVVTDKVDLDCGHQMGT